MFQSARKKLPAVDYVSVVRSLYSDPPSMLYGALAATIAAAVSGVKTGAPAFFVIAAVFLLIGFARNLDARAFAKARVRAEDAEAAERWEIRATFGGVSIALAHGIWCVVSFTLVDDSFVRFAATTATVAALVGVAARNFGIDRLVTLQSLFMSLPIALGIFIFGDIYYKILAICLLPFFLAIRRISGIVRGILLNAVHGRVEASRLAAELDAALTTMPHGLAMLDSTGKLAVVNWQARRAFSSNSPDSWIGRHFSEVLRDIQRSGALSEATAAYIETEIRKGENTTLMFGLSDGRQYELRVNSKLGRTVLMIEDISDRVAAAERINFMARYDDLTHLANRSFFSEQVEAQLNELDEVELGDNKCMMMVVDIDDFKHVNDTLGHPVGDALLLEVGNRIRAIFGTRALIGRFGGDEFTIFQSNDATEAGAHGDAQAILSALQVPIVARNKVLTVKVSIGVVVAKKPNGGLDTLLTRSDLALYRAKGEGKGQYRLFEDDMDVEYKQRQKLRADLLTALDDDEFYLLFQPIVNLTTGKISGCEALIRWRHKELGLIPPMTFIPIAEDMGAMPAITRWVLEQATRECMGWPEHLSVSVNLSATDFRDGDVVEMVDRALKISGLPASRLTVEVTETAIVEELDGAVQALTKVRTMGTDVALDDFGTGYSSLNYLHKMPFTKLKIDRSFVVDVTTSERSRKLLASITHLSKSLDLTVTVEGIETEEQLRVITETTDVDLAQGYLFGAPLPRAEILELVHRTSPAKSALMQKVHAS